MSDFDDYDLTDDLYSYGGSPNGKYKRRARDLILWLFKLHVDLSMVRPRLFFKG